MTDLQKIECVIKEVVEANGADEKQVRGNCSFKVNGNVVTVSEPFTDTKWDYTLDEQGCVIDIRDYEN